MDYAFYNTQAQPSFHQQSQFGGFTTPTSQYAQPVGTQPEAYMHSNDFQQYDSQYQFNNGANFAQQQPQQQPSPPLHNDAQDLKSRKGSNGLTHNGDFDVDLQEQDGDLSGSEEKESLTPAQSRRKAQNRAAQRAFRERKEKHVKDLENKLNSLSAHSTTLLSDNERLKRELQRLSTQNEILRATSSHSGSNPARSPSPVPGPQVFSPIDFQAAIGEGQHPVSFEDFGGPHGQRLLAVGAAWDLIMNHEAYKRGQVNIEAVHARLKGQTLCNGRGPAFKEEDVLRAIHESTSHGTDELL